MLSFRFLPFAMLMLIAQTVFSQGIKGRLTDMNNNSIPFAAIYDESSYTGTTSNADGYYELRLPAGKHSLVFKSLGYFVEKRSVNIVSSFITINLQLKEQAYELKDVVVIPGKEDPAYAIMRKAIGLAPYHLHQVKDYTADVYLRGSIHIIKIPKFISKRIEVNGKKGAIKNGDVYMEESINQIDFKAPDKYEQKVKSFRTNFPGENSVSPMTIIRASFYQPKIDEAISPLAPNAFSFYKFRYEGYSREGEYTIFKIKVTPKRNSQQLLSGYIFIIDNLWCLHSVDVSQQMFFGTLNYKEIFSPVKGNAWLPISYAFYVNAAMMGVKADYKYTSSVKYQKVQLNEKKIVKPVQIAEDKEVPEKPKVAEKKPDSKKAKKEQELERLIAKENLSNRDMVKLATLMAKEAPADTAKTQSLEIKEENNTKVTIEKDAMKKDTAFWNTVRPIPLTTVESGLSDSIRIPASADTTARQNSLSIGSSKNDTTPSKTKKIMGKAGKYVFGGASFGMFHSKVRFTYNGLIGLSKFDFNTVDGFIYKQSFDVSVKVDSSHRLLIKPMASYGFSRKEFMWGVNTTYDYAPMRNGSLKLSYSKSSTDYNQNGPVSKHINALASLVFRRNYKKFYEEHQVNLTNSIELATGFVFIGSAGFRQEIILDNHSDYSFFYRKTRDYWSNIPVTDTEALLKNVDNREAYVSAGFEYTPRYYYKVRGGKKHYQHSKYPTFFTQYKKAIQGILNSTASFDYLELGARQTKTWGMMHSFSWHLAAGAFLTKDEIYLSDYKFFSNQPLPVILGKTHNSFFLPTLYENALNSNFIEGHLTFTTPYLLIKYLPFLSNKIWLENLHLNYLHSQNIGHYWETGYSVSQIYALGGVGVYAGFKDTRFESAGVRVTLAF